MKVPDIINLPNLAAVLFSPITTVFSRLSRSPSTTIWSRLSRPIPHHDDIVTHHLDIFYNSCRYHPAPDSTYFHLIKDPVGMHFFPLFCFSTAVHVLPVQTPTTNIDPSPGCFLKLMKTNCQY